VHLVRRPGGPAGVQLTVSEMNVDGLDDAALGQGDTMTVAIPRSQLAPGMIQFIHRPPPGYTPPPWPAGPDAAASSLPPASDDPSLTVGLAHDRVETVSESPAPVVATVTSPPGGTVAARMSLPANRVIGLHLPGGSYRVCVLQAAGAAGRPGVERPDRGKR
jgi:hypothetical protein